MPTTVVSTSDHTSELVVCTFEFLRPEPDLDYTDSQIRLTESSPLPTGKSGFRSHHNSESNPFTDVYLASNLATAWHVANGYMLYQLPANPNPQYGLLYNVRRSKYE